MQAKSRAYATEQIAQQMADFKRASACWATGPHRYATMDFANEAGRDPRLQARSSSAASSTAA